MKTGTLVSCLTRLHNFCIDKGDRLCELSLVEETLPLDLEHMINNPDWYVPLMTDNNYDIAIPIAIMDAGHHFDGCPQAARRSKCTDGVALTYDLPRTILLNHVVDSHKTCPHTNAQIKKNIKNYLLTINYPCVGETLCCHLQTHNGI